MLPRRRRGRTLAYWCFVTCLVLLYVRYLQFSESQDSKNTKDLEPKDLQVMQAQIIYQRQQRFLKYQRSEGNRTGPGEQGRGFILQGDDKTKGDAAFAKDGFNYVASDLISLERSLPDTRPKACRSIEYPSHLPTASVIIVFYNEYWSAILRTVHSVVNRTPPQYLQEVILLDDASNKTELLEPLEKYVKDTWPDGVVKLVRRKERGGLIRARLTGADAATGDVLIFLDAHCEANKGWIEPLLSRIQEDRKVVLIPTIQVIGAETLQFSGGGGTAVGGFSWHLHFTWESLPEREKKRRTYPHDNYRTPTMPGGLLAIGKDWFYESGTYDQDMEIWGGENLEMSFRVWMCGGSMEMVPCSHVGHIFRATHPYGFPSKTRDYHGLNSKRLAEVWMDDYKNIFYLFRPELRRVDVGDLTQRHELRKKLQCKDFAWFLKNVNPEMFIYNENVQVFGIAKNVESGLCFDTLSVDEKRPWTLSIWTCQIQPTYSANQIFALSDIGELRRETMCADATKVGDFIQMFPCHGGKGNQEWLYDKETQQLVHKNTNLCIDVEGLKLRDKLNLKDCNKESPFQKWTFVELNLKP